MKKPGWWHSAQHTHCKTRCRAAWQGTRLEVDGRLGRSVFQLGLHQPTSGLIHAMLSLTQARLHHQAYSALGGCSGGGLCPQETEVHQAGS